MLNSAPDWEKHLFRDICQRFEQDITMKSCRKVRASCKYFYFSDSCFRSFHLNAHRCFSDSLAFQNCCICKKNSRACSLDQKNIVYITHVSLCVQRQNISSRRNRKWRVKATDLSKRPNQIAVFCNKVGVESQWMQCIHAEEYSYIVTKHSRSQAFLVERIWTPN